MLAALRAEVQLVAMFPQVIGVPALWRQSENLSTPAAHPLPVVKVLESLMHSPFPHRSEEIRMAIFLTVMPFLRKSSRM